MANAKFTRNWLDLSDFVRRAVRLPVDVPGNHRTPGLPDFRDAAGDNVEACAVGTELKLAEDSMRETESTLPGETLDSNRQG